MTALEVRSVSKTLDRRLVLDDISFQLMEGEAIALIGPSGCGKTTLLRLIAGLDAPDQGEIRLNGTVASANARVLLRPHTREVGFVFQDLALWPHMTVAGNLRFVLGPKGLTAVEREQRIAESLALVRIDRLADKHPHQLSGGEQQRCALARAIVTRPRLLLLDEPLSSLDADLRTLLRSELVRVHELLNVTMIHVTHDVVEAHAVAGRVLRMQHGRIVAENARPK